MKQELFPIWTQGSITLCRVSDEGYVVTYSSEGAGHTEVVTGIASLFEKIVTLTGRAEYYGQLVYMVSLAVETRESEFIEHAIDILKDQLELAKKTEQLYDRAKDSGVVKD